MNGLAAAFFLLLTAAARADDAAYAAYARGDYAAAIDLAVAAGGPGDLALAARAMNAVSYFDGERKSARRVADDAYAMATKAIVLDPSLPEAHLQAAIGLGLKGARMSPVKAFFTGLAGKAREEIDAALALDPSNPWALSTSAAWRIEVARRGGGAVYDADPLLGHAEFMKARAAAPDNVTVAYECALRLLADGRAEWRADGLSSLDAAIAAAPTTKFEADVQGLARDFKAAIVGGHDAERAFIGAQP